MHNCHLRRLARIRAVALPPPGRRGRGGGGGPATTTTLAGTGDRGDTDGPAAAATFRGPFGLAVASDGAVFVSEQVRRLETRRSCESYQARPPSTPRLA